MSNCCESMSEYAGRVWIYMLVENEWVYWKIMNKFVERVWVVLLICWEIVLGKYEWVCWESMNKYAWKVWLICWESMSECTGWVWVWYQGVNIDVLASLMTTMIHHWRKNKWHPWIFKNNYDWHICILNNNQEWHP